MAASPPPWTALLPAAAASPLLRGCLLTTAMTGLSLVNQLLIHGYITLLEHHDVYFRTARPPALGLGKQLLHSILGWLGYMAPLCVLEAAWPRPWSYALPSMPAVCYGVLMLMLCLDFWCAHVLQPERSCGDVMTPRAGVAVPHPSWHVTRNTAAT